MEPTNGAHCVSSAYREYLAWLHRSTRITLRPPVSIIPIDEEGSDDDDPYDVMTRTSIQPQRAPLQNYMVNFSIQLCLHTFLLDKYVVMVNMHVL